MKRKYVVSKCYSIWKDINNKTRVVSPDLRLDLLTHYYEKESIIIFDTIQEALSFLSSYIKNLEKNNSKYSFSPLEVENHFICVNNNNYDDINKFTGQWIYRLYLDCCIFNENNHLKLHEFSKEDKKYLNKKIKKEGF